MKLVAVLLATPHVWAWTPPIFMDTMKFDISEQHGDDRRQLQLQTVGGGSAPTASPTESPAPSPSPSAFPTGGPTVTAKPTGTPTANPTESPAPSPSPSAFPTTSPTKAPTGTPSAHPTISPQPTSGPTTSRAPSSTPTYSPSESPSTNPTVLPTASPTYIGEIQASFVVDFEIDQLLGKFETDAFEVATKRWISYSPLGEGSIDDISVDVYNQVIKTKPSTGNETQEIEKFLQIFFLVHVEYTGTNTEFDLFALLNPKFQTMNSNWLRELSIEDSAFAFLGPATISGAIEDSERSQESVNDKRKPISKKSYTGILLVSFFALIMAVVASVYAIRTHNLSTFGTELRSPSGQLDGRPSYLEHDLEAKVTSTESDLSSKPFTMKHAPLHDSRATQSASFHHQKQILRNNQQQQQQKESTLQSHQAQSQGTRPTHQVPPPPPPLPKTYVRNSEESLHTNRKKDRDPIAKRVSEIPEPPAFSEVNFGRDSSLFDRQSLSSEVTTESDSLVPPGRISDTMAERIAKFEKASDASKGGQELLLTKSFGGTLGAKSVSNPGTASDISSQAKAFFDNLVKKTSEQINGTIPTKQNAQPSKAPVARPGARENQRGTDNRRSSYDSVLRKPGLYDVLAPPGPIGIVVDTTDNGPAVHSLKNTSPMIGLIAPGDLIVGLDDTDTRGTTAATLTRLMAQKANQKERKITLLTVEEY